MSTIIKIENDLYNQNAFVSHLTGLKSNLWHHLSVVNVWEMKNIFLNLKDNYSKEEWLDACSYWQEHEHISPCAGTLAKVIKVFLKTL